MHKQQWMTDLMGDLEGKRLCDLCLPGSHDSGSYKFTAEEYDPYNDKWEKIATAMLATGFVSSLSLGPGAFATGIALQQLLVSTIKAWGQSQSENLYDQLMHGIRFLDLRVMRSEDDGELYLYHGFVCESLKTGLADIKEFLDRDNKSELVIVQFINMKVDTSDYAKINKMIVDAFDDHIFPSHNDFPASHSDSANLFVLSHTLGDIVGVRARSRVIVMFDNANFEKAGADVRFVRRGDIFPGSNFQWHETADPAALATGAATQVQTYASNYKNAIKGKGQRPLLGLQWIITPGTDAILGSVKNRFDPTTGRHDLEWFSDKVAHTLGHFIDEHEPPVNVIMTDFVNRSAVVELAIGISREVAHPKTTMIKGSKHHNFLTSTTFVGDWNDEAKTIDMVNGTWVYFRDKDFDGDSKNDIYGPMQALTKTPHIEWDDGQKIIAKPSGPSSAAWVGEVSSMRPLPDYGIMLFSGRYYQGESFHLVAKGAHDLNHEDAPSWTKKPGSIAVGSGLWKMQMNATGKQDKSGYFQIPLPIHAAINDFQVYLGDIETELGMKPLAIWARSDEGLQEYNNSANVILGTHQDSGYHDVTTYTLEAHGGTLTFSSDGSANFYDHIGRKYHDLAEYAVPLGASVQYSDGLLSILHDSQMRTYEFSKQGIGKTIFEMTFKSGDAGTSTMLERGCTLEFDRAKQVGIYRDARGNVYHTQPKLVNSWQDIIYTNGAIVLYSALNGTLNAHRVNSDFVMAEHVASYSIGLNYTISSVTRGEVICTPQGQAASMIYEVSQTFMEQKAKP